MPVSKKRKPGRKPSNSGRTNTGRVTAKTVKPEVTITEGDEHIEMGKVTKRRVGNQVVGEYMTAPIPTGYQGLGRAWFVLGGLVAVLVIIGALLGLVSLAAAGICLIADGAVGLRSVGGKTVSKLVWWTAIAVQALIAVAMVVVDSWIGLIGVFFILCGVVAAQATWQMFAPARCSVPKDIIRSLDAMPGVEYQTAATAGGLPIVTNVMTGDIAVLGYVGVGDADSLKGSRVFADFLSRYNHLTGFYQRYGISLRGVVILGELDKFGPLRLREHDGDIYVSSKNRLRQALVNVVHGR